jgi:hypothetical protein
MERLLEIYPEQVFTSVLMVHGSLLVMQCIVNH